MSVRVVGPLWGLQSRSYGYDMQPDTKLTPKQLAGFFTPWHYAKIRMAWEGDWVSIQPIAARTAEIGTAPTSTAATGPAEPVRPKPSATSTPPPSATATATNGSPTPGNVALAGGVSPAATGGDGVSRTEAARTGGSTEDAGSAWIGAAVVAAMVLAVAIAGAGVRRRSARVRRRPAAG
jgi:hypothetical protein